jgi:hypothetical protein
VPVSVKTADELMALPVFNGYGQDRYEVQPDGTVTLPDGRVIRGLTGKYLTVPKIGDQMMAMSLDDFYSWVCANGDCWHTVMTRDGLKRMLV